MPLFITSQLNESIGVSRLFLLHPHPHSGKAKFKLSFSRGNLRVNLKMVHLSVRLKYLLMKIQSSFAPQKHQIDKQLLNLCIKIMFSNGFKIKIKMDLRNKCRIIEIKRDVMSFLQERVLIEIMT